MSDREPDLGGRRIAITSPRDASFSDARRFGRQVLASIAGAGASSRQMTAGDAPHSAPQRPAPTPPDPRSTAFVLLGATLPILLSLVMKSWVSGSRQGAEAGIGLTGIDVCMEGVCRDLPWSAWKLDGDVSTFAVLSLILGIVAMLVAGTYGGLALKGLAHKLPPAKYGVIVFAVTGFVMAYFSIRVITESPGGLGPGGGMLFGIAGVIAGGVGMRRLAAAKLGPTPWAGAAVGQAPQLDAETAALLAPKPAAQPVAPAVPAAARPAAAPQPVAAQPVAAPTSTAKCPRCGSALTYVAQYQRWFCERCRQYA